jgi:DNA-directed RNA polymerase specialized sigma24 family protein
VAGHVFLSYVRENASIVERLAAELQAVGVTTWLDQNSLAPGDRWRDVIRDAIRNGDLFIACFSRAYVERNRSHMNEELTLAIDELRLRTAERTWFIPVLLDKCEVPDRPIGAGQSLRDFQHVDLEQNWQKGIASIAAVARAQRGALANPPSASQSAASAVTEAVSRASQSLPARHHAALMLKETEKWTLRDDFGQTSEFTLSTIMRFAARGLFDASTADIKLRRPGASGWQTPSQIPELVPALAARGAHRPQKGGRLWTVSIAGGHEQIDLDRILDLINQRRITASTLVAAPARPNEFRPAADWPIFWRKFGTAPYVLQFMNGSEYFVENQTNCGVG